jgi:hypothetical protein
MELRKWLKLCDGVFAATREISTLRTIDCELPLGFGSKGCESLKLLASLKLVASIENP